jgi:hypothetical protein
MNGAFMSVIIPFKLRPRQHAGQSEPNGTAQILLYTGVRYERHEEPQPAPATPSGISGNGQSRRTRRRA